MDVVFCIKRHTLTKYAFFNEIHEKKQLFSYVIMSLQGVYYNFDSLIWKKGRCLCFTTISSGIA